MSDSDRNTTGRDRWRANLLRFTRRAYRMLPDLDKPRILDIGCGSGVATLELARLSGGDVVALDIDAVALDRLRARAAEENISGRVTVICISMEDMAFPAGSFDLVWTEGAMAFIGFERGLSRWRTLLVPHGYLVVHDTLAGWQKKLESARACGYAVVDRFDVSADTWWNEYYAPLKRRLEELRATNPTDPSVVAEMAAAERDIGEFDIHDDRYASFFLILKKE